MSVPTASAAFTLHEPVRLAAACDGFAKGIRGTVVEVYPDAEWYAVELFDDEGETLDVVDLPRAALTVA